MTETKSMSASRTQLWSSVVILKTIGVTNACFVTFLRPTLCQSLCHDIFFTMINSAECHSLSGRGVFFSLIETPDRLIEFPGNCSAMQLLFPPSHTAHCTLCSVHTSNASDASVSPATKANRPRVTRGRPAPCTEWWGTFYSNMCCPPVKLLPKYFKPVWWELCEGRSKQNSAL